MTTISFARHQFPSDVIRHAVWLYFRFTLSFRDVEDLLAERGLDVSYETVRRWVLKFGPLFARELRRRRHRPTSQWHLDEMAVLIAGRRFWLWRAVDDEGEVLDLLVQRRRDARAATKLMRKLLKKQGFAPKTLVTDRLRSYGAAKTQLGLSARHEQGLRKNNRAKIRICQCDDASRRCNVSNRADRRNGSYPFTPSSITRSTFSAILFPATRSAPSEAKRSRIGRQQRRPELEPSPSDFRSAKAKFP
jgi:transposase-like protein